MDKPPHSARTNTFTCGPGEFAHSTPPFATEKHWICHLCVCACTSQVHEFNENSVTAKTTRGGTTWDIRSASPIKLCGWRGKMTDDTLVTVSLEPMRMVTKLGRKSLRALEKSGSPQCARTESGSLGSRSHCPSLCRQSTKKRTREREREWNKGRTKGGEARYNTSHFPKDK